MANNGVLYLELFTLLGERVSNSTCNIGCDATGTAASDVDEAVPMRPTDAVGLVPLYGCPTQSLDLGVCDPLPDAFDRSSLRGDLGALRCSPLPYVGLKGSSTVTLEENENGTPSTIT